MEWSKSTNTFWMGANNCEYIAWKGSHQVFEYHCDTYPAPPVRIIQHDKRIETLEEFNAALENGEWFNASYENTKQSEERNKEATELLF